MRITLGDTRQATTIPVDLESCALKSSLERLFKEDALAIQLQLANVSINDND